MTVFNIDEDQGVWFDLDGGGRVKLRSVSIDDFKVIRKQTVKKKVDFKKIEGTPARLEYEEINDDLQSELFWDHVIMDWEKFLDGKDNEIPCTKENKILLMSRSAKFAKIVGDALKVLTDSEAEQAEAAEKN